MCFTAIPGKTGLPATRNVPTPTRKQKPNQVPKKVAAPKKTATAVLIENPSFIGGTLQKKNENTKTYSQYKQNVRAQNAKQHSLRVRPLRESLRQFNHQRLS